MNLFMINLISYFDSNFYLGDQKADDVHSQMEDRKVQRVPHASAYRRSLFKLQLF